MITGKTSVRSWPRIVSLIYWPPLRAWKQLEILRQRSVSKSSVKANKNQRRLKPVGSPEWLAVASLKWDINCHVTALWIELWQKLVSWKLGAFTVEGLNLWEGKAFKTEFLGKVTKLYKLFTCRFYVLMRKLQLCLHSFRLGPGLVGLKQLHATLPRCLTSGKNLPKKGLRLNCVSNGKWTFIYTALFWSFTPPSSLTYATFRHSNTDGTAIGSKLGSSILPMQDSV